MRCSTILLGLLLAAPFAGVSAADTPAPAPAIASGPATPPTSPKITAIERRLETIDKRLAAQRAHRDEVATAVTTAQDGLTKLKEQLALIDKLSTDLQSEHKASTNGMVSPATVAALDEANAALTPLQRHKREWSRTVLDGKSVLAETDQAIARLETEHERVSSELEKAKAPVADQPAK